MQGGGWVGNGRGLGGWGGVVVWEGLGVVLYHGIQAGKNDKHIHIRQ